MTGFQKMIWFVIVPILCLIAIGIVLFAFGMGDLAVLVTNLGTPIVLVAGMLYIVFFDSRKRWPGVSWHTRLGRLMTFQRG